MAIFISNKISQLESKSQNRVRSPFYTLFLKVWTNDRERCERAGVPEKHPFATKPLAQQMLKRAFDAGVPAAWVTGDSVYGDDRRLRVWLEEQDHAYVLAVSGKEYVWRAGRQHQVKTLLAALAAEGWCRLSAGDGAKGPAGMTGVAPPGRAAGSPTGAGGSWCAGV